MDERTVSEAVRVGYVGVSSAVGPLGVECVEWSGWGKRQ